MTLIQFIGSLFLFILCLAYIIYGVSLVKDFIDNAGIDKNNKGK